MNLEGKVVLITGASGGIGSCLVDQFIKAGATKIYAGDLSAEKLEPMQEKYGSMIVPLRLDVAREDLLKPVLQQCMDVDILVNNAGIKFGIDCIDLGSTKTAMVEMMVNYFGVHNMSMLLWYVLKNKKSAAIVNILSIASFELLPDCATYCASKAAARMLTLALRKESEGTNIKVFAMYPGYVDTPMVENTEVEKMSPEFIAESIIEAMQLDYLDFHFNKFTNRST